MRPDDELVEETPEREVSKSAIMSPPPIQHLPTEIEPSTGDVSGPEEPTEPIITAPPEEPKKPRKRKRGMLLILLLLVILVGGGVAAYMVMNKPEETKTATKTSTEPKKVAPKLTAAQLLVEEIRDEVEGQDVTSEAQAPPPFKPADYDFYVYPEQKFVMKRTGSQTVVNDSLKTIRELLNEKGYAEDIQQVGDADAMFVAYASTDDVQCYVYDMKPFSPSPTDIRYEAGLSCADTPSYTVAAKGLKVYVDAYAEKSEDEVPNSLFNGLKVEKSKTVGYARAEVGVGGADFDSVGGFAAMFYQTPDKTWHYFIGTQNIVPCADFNTDDLKKAYVGEPCYDTATDNEQATVSL